MKKIFFVFIFITIFLSGCSSVKNSNIVVNKDNIIKTEDSSKTVSDVNTDSSASPSNEKPIIDKCDTVDCIVYRLQNCKMSQYIWNNASGFKVIAVLGDQDGKCRVMFNDNNLKNNLSCLFDSEALKEDIMKAFIDEQYSKEIIAKNCKKAEINFQE